MNNGEPCKATIDNPMTVSLIIPAYIIKQAVSSQRQPVENDKK